MKIRVLYAAGLAAVVAVVFFSLLSDTTAQQAQQAKSNKAMTPVERGKWLVDFGGCHDCHTPKKMTPQGPVFDETRALSGHPAEAKPAPIAPGALTPDGWMAMTNMHLTAWAGPWGISFTANLTPDVATGLGSWTEEMFLKALRTGKHMGEGRDILPPMPWFNFAYLDDSDIKAIFAYLKTLKPIKNAVPDPVPPPTMKK
jgi:mono/diheme cytochrome c family protein